MGIGQCFVGLFACGTKVRPYGHPVITLAIVGLDNAGKTTLLATIRGDPPGPTVPTWGFINSEWRCGHAKLAIYDLGGSRNIRRIWERYFAEVHGVVFVVDAAARERLPEAKEALAGALSNAYLAGKPLLVFANKQDIEAALSADAITECLGLPSLSGLDYLTLPCTSQRNDNSPADPHVQEGIRWLVNAIEGRYDELNPRVTREAAEQMALEQRLKAERKARVEAARAERAREEDTTESQVEGSRQDNGKASQADRAREGNDMAAPPSGSEGEAQAALCRSTEGLSTVGSGPTNEACNGGALQTDLLMGGAASVAASQTPGGTSLTEPRPELASGHGQGPLHEATIVVGTEAAASASITAATAFAVLPPSWPEAATAVAAAAAAAAGPAQERVTRHPHPLTPTTILPPARTDSMIAQTQAPPAALLSARDDPLNASRSRQPLDGHGPLREPLAATCHMEGEQLRAGEHAATSQHASGCAVETCIGTRAGEPTPAADQCAGPAPWLPQPHDSCSTASLNRGAEEQPAADAGLESGLEVGTSAAAGTAAEETGPAAATAAEETGPAAACGEQGGGGTVPLSVLADILTTAPSPVMPDVRLRAKMGLRGEGHPLAVPTELSIPGAV